MGRPGAGAPGLTSVAPPVFESSVAGRPGTHARSRTGAGPGNIGGNRPPAGHKTSGQGLAVGPAAALGGRARLVGVACAGAQRTATPSPGGLGRGMPPGAGVAAVHRFGGTGTALTSHLWGARAEVCRPACTQGMTVTSSETECSLLRAPQTGATWTGVRVRKHQISDLAACPYCGPPPETEVHLLWDSPQWHTQRAAWLPLVRAEAAHLPALALPSAWPVCLRATGLLPAALVRPEEVDQAGRLMYRLYGMYLAVLSARMGAEVAARRDAGARPSVFAIARRRPPDARRDYPWGQWAGAHIPWRHQRRRLPCAPARRRGGRGRRPSRWRSCSGLADCGGYQGRAT